MTITAGICIDRNNIYGIKFKFDEKNTHTLHGQGLFNHEQLARMEVIQEPIEQPSILALKTIVKRLCEEGDKPDLVGIACYGPFKSLNLQDRQLAEEGKLSDYGAISEASHFAPYAGWDLFSNITKEFKRYDCNPQISIQTDVGASALAEWIYRSETGGANQEKSKHHTIAFLNFSEGVGGAVVSNGKLLNGALHPEMGQISVKLHEHDNEENFKGVCPHHTDCLEGLTSTNALLKRIRRKVTLDEMIDDPDNPFWEIQAWYMAQLCTSVTLLFAPSLIVVGGKILKCKSLLPFVEKWHKKMLGGRDNDAFASYSLLSRSDGFIQTSAMSQPGVVGAACIPLAHPGSDNIETL